VQQHLGHGVSSRLKFVRAASAAVTLVSAGVLGLVVAESGGTVTKHTVTTRHVVHTPVTEAQPATPATPTPTASAAPVASALAPTSTAATSTPAPSPVVTTAASTATTPSVAPTPPSPSTPTTTAIPGVTANALPACPLGLSAPTNSGGLQSLIGFAPVFGPFSAEAFASAAAFQPVLELIGPFLVAFANAYAPYSTAFAPLLTAVESLENLGYSTLIEPFSAAYQTELLTAETQLATALAPGASALLDNPVSSCVVDIEGLLTGDS
jgi:hypothetical protein